MKRALLIFEVLGLLFFSAALVWSFQAEQWVLEKARVSIQEQIRPKADLAVDLAEEGLRSKLASTYLAEDQISDSLQELTLYRADPSEYIRSITGSGFAINADSAGSRAGLSRLADRFLNWKARIQSHFDQTFARLMGDFRLFLATTAIAFALAVFLLMRSDNISRQYFVASAVLALATVYSAFSYIDQNWFFTILLNNYMGWGYPLGLGMLFGWLLFEYYKNKRETEF